MDNRKKTTTKRKGNYKRKPNFKDSKFKDRDKTEFRDSVSDDHNDPEWYAKYPELMVASASLPYSIPTGAKVDWSGLHIDPARPLYQGTLFDLVYASVPGIVTLGICPTPGLSRDGSSPINIAARMAYTKVRAENSGAKNYDAPDLMLYYLAMDQIYSLVTWMNRVYGSVMLYAQRNRYLPAALCHAQKVDFNDIMNNINDFKAFIDTCTAQAAAFAVPADIPLFSRHAFMYQNVYKDAESEKSQMYMFAPHVFYKYNEFQGAGQLEPINLDVRFGSASDLTYADFISLWHEMMDPIVLSEDFNIMSGDTLKAFGAEGTVKLSLMPMGYTITPIADYEVLTQIKNATVAKNAAGAAPGSGSTQYSWNIFQDVNTNSIIFDPVIATQQTGAFYDYTDDLLLSTYKSEPEAKDNMVYSRLMYTLESEEDTTTTPTTYNQKFATVGSEFVTRTAVTGFRTINNVWTYNSVLTSTSSMGVTTWDYALIRTALAKHFDFHPAIYVFINNSGNTVFIPVIDLDNWTLVHTYELDKMHRTAILSMFRVPMLGSALPAPRAK